MVKEIIWADSARKELKATFDYWNKRNSSFQYSSRIQTNIIALHQILKLNPYLGQPTNLLSVRAKTFMKHFQVIYKIEGERLIVLNFWDTRQSANKASWKKK